MDGLTVEEGLLLTRKRVCFYLSMIMIIGKCAVFMREGCVCCFCFSIFTSVSKPPGPPPVIQTHVRTRSHTRTHTQT